MKKRLLVGFIGMFMMSALVCGSSFAVEIPDGFTRNDALSTQALGMAKQQFTLLKQQLIMMAQNSSADQQAMINQALSMVTDKLDRLEKIDIYEATKDSAYDDAYALYKGTLENFQDVNNEEVKFTVTQIPPQMVPPQTMQTLNTLIGQGKVRAATGSSGKSRVSLSTVYIDPGTFNVIEGTTLVIATDK